MERKTFDDAPCAIARTLDILGDWWTPLIIRECLYGVHRFDEMQRWLGIGRNILTKRLAQLIEQGVLDKRLYQDRPPRYEYHLTDKGYDAANLLVAMIPFGERWLFPEDRPPIALFDRRTGRRVRPGIVDLETGQPIEAAEVFAGPGPEFPDEPEIKRARFAEYYDRGGEG